MSEPPEPDQEPGAARPRQSHALFGHLDAERTLAEAFAAGRTHHAWMLCGPKGVGKATLAYRAARRLLGARPEPGQPLASLAEDPVSRRIAALSHPDLFVLRRGVDDRGRTRQEITVQEARALTRFFTLKPAEGGWRVAIIDSVDELNRSAANAILKTLEEPPARCALFLIAHAPGAALATIRSRCRRLVLRPLDPDAMAAALTAAGMDGQADAALLSLAAGRPGRAIALVSRGGAEAARRLSDALGDGRAGALMPAAFDRGGEAGEARTALFLDLALAETHALARRCALSGAAVAEAWASAYEALSAIRTEWEALSIDPAHAYLRAVEALERAQRAQ